MSERARRRTAAIVAVSATTVVWGSVGVFVKTTSISGLTFAMYRLWLGAVVHEQPRPDFWFMRFDRPGA